MSDDNQLRSVSKVSKSVEINKTTTVIIYYLVPSFEIQADIFKSLESI